MSSEVIKLNLGSGSNPLDGYVNVDKFGAPDVCHDLEVFPWPWGDGSVSEVVMQHVLEHLGSSTDIFFGVIRELYRVCVDGAKIEIKVPHPRHDEFLSDPTHVRPITADSLVLFSKAKNREWAEQGIANSPLGLHLDVDFEIVSSNFVLEEDWLRRFNNKEISDVEVFQAIRQFNNVAKEIWITLVVRK